MSNGYGYGLEATVEDLLKRAQACEFSAATLRRFGLIFEPARYEQWAAEWRAEVERVRAGRPTVAFYDAVRAIELKPPSAIAS